MQITAQNVVKDNKKNMTSWCNKGSTTHTCVPRLIVSTSTFSRDMIIQFPKARAGILLKDIISYLS